MSSCKHQNLVLIPQRNNKLRCRHCHLTIEEDDLTDDYCPECYEAYGIKHNDFEKVETVDDGKICYCCENCGAIVTC